MRRPFVAVLALATATTAACASPAETTPAATDPTDPPTTIDTTTTTSAPPAAVTSDDPGSADSTDVVPSTTGTTPASTTVPATTPATTSTTVPAAPPPVDRLEGLDLELELVADIAKPTAIAFRQGDPAMYVSSQTGPIHRVGDETTVVLDLTDETFEDLPGSERGVLGLAFDPRDGRMFVDYTDLADNTRVVSYELADGVAVEDSRRDVLEIEQPGVGHNGGRIFFDADGRLHIGSGDGGGSNGRDAQDPTTLLGAILRIIPNVDGDGYTIPPDNPFADGTDDRPEVIARGLRNPWSFSLDDATGDIWIGDVGNEAFEEIDLLPADELGRNFGWYFFEGTNQRYSEVPEGLTPPVHDYPRSDGVAVMGGYVYRGDAIPELRGAYVFGDLTGPVWAIGSNGVARLDVEPVNTLVGWGEDPAGELYLFGLYDGVFRLGPASGGG